jgi:hypothetical protein
MPDTVAREEIDARIARLRENIRELVEQAAGSSGAADESRNADRIASYEAELAAALKERETMR